jgi:hypothetical protein
LICRLLGGLVYGLDLGFLLGHPIVIHRHQAFLDIWHQAEISILAFFIPERIFDCVEIDLNAPGEGVIRDRPMEVQNIRLVVRVPLLFAQ